MGSMTDPSQMRKNAVALIREALLLLDEAGENVAAAHLQFAIDIAAKSNPIRTNQYGLNREAD
jgi:hypothetical protein